MNVASIVCFVYNLCVLVIFWNMRDVFSYPHMVCSNNSVCEYLLNDDPSTKHTALKIRSCLQPWTSFAESSMLDAWHGSEYTSVDISQIHPEHAK